jgi:hypothetical protein
MQGFFATKSSSFLWQKSNTKVLLFVRQKLYHNFWVAVNRGFPLCCFYTTWHDSCATAPGMILAISKIRAKLQ